MISIFTLNIRSLNKNFDDLLSYFSSADFWPDAIVLTETWYTEDCKYLTISGYDSFFYSSNKNKCSGVAIFTKNELKAHVNLMNQYCFDCLNVKIIVNETSVSIIGIYNSPSNSYYVFAEDFELLLSSIPSKSLTYITGDFNIDVLRNDANSTSYLQLCSSYNFLITNKVMPTRQTELSDTCIDHVVTNSDLDNEKTQIIKTDVSDHYGILHVTGLQEGKAPPPSQIYFRNFSKLGDDIHCCKFLF